LIKLLKELNHPETKKALYFALQFLKSLSSINSNGHSDLAKENLISTNTINK
jgi:uncharacterized protein YjgD (DUF1641 family)